MEKMKKNNIVDDSQSKKVIDSKNKYKPYKLVWDQEINQDKKDYLKMVEENPDVALSTKEFMNIKDIRSDIKNTDWHNALKILSQMWIDLDPRYDPIKNSITMSIWDHKAINIDLTKYKNENIQIFNDTIWKFICDHFDLSIVAHNNNTVLLKNKSQKIMEIIKTPGISLYDQILKDINSKSSNILQNI